MTQLGQFDIGKPKEKKKFIRELNFIFEISQLYFNSLCISNNSDFL